MRGGRAARSTRAAQNANGGQEQARPLKLAAYWRRCGSPPFHCAAPGGRAPMPSLSGGRASSPQRVRQRA
eukprot:1518429-Alexandrium_andersonii.AAC.1